MCLPTRPLNSWNETEQGLEYVMNVMGSIPPPPASTQFGSFPMPHISPAEEFINLCKGLNIAVNSIAQASELQQNLLMNEEVRNSKTTLANSGRIFLFTSALNRNLDSIQDFLNKTIEETNKNIENIIRNDK